MIRKFILAGLGASLAVTPLAAQQVTQRASAPVEGENELVGQSDLFFYLGIAAVVAAVLVLSEDDDPTSP